MKFGIYINKIKYTVTAVILAAALSSCEKMIGGGMDTEQIVVRSIVTEGTSVTKGTAIDSDADLLGLNFGIYASRIPASSSEQIYFEDAKAKVNGDYTASLSPIRYWPDEATDRLKFFSWYPCDGSYTPTASFAAGRLSLNYTVNTNAANHVDVLTAVSEPLAWKSPVSIHFYHTLTKVSFTFKKVAPAPDVVTINKIEFQDIGKSGKLVVTEIPAVSSSAKPAFSWGDVTTGTVTSTITSGNTVTGTVAKIGDTFLMLPTDNFSSAAKIVITTNWGTNEFNLREVVAASAHTWKSGEYINYNITLSDKIFEITAQSLPWDTNPVDVIFDKQYYLNVEYKLIELANNSAQVFVNVETNYKLDTDPNTGYPAGVFLSSIANPEGNDSYLELGWARVYRPNATISSGVYTYKLEINVDSYNGTGDSRDVFFNIKAGNLIQQMRIKQYRGATDWMTVSRVLDDSGVSGTVPRYKLVFTSGYAGNSSAGEPGAWTWKVTDVSDPDGILMNRETMVGVSGGNGDALYYYYKTNAPTGKTATLTLKNTNGNNPPLTIVVPGLY